MSLKEVEIQEKILQIVQENNRNPNGITKTELARIFIERWGTSKAPIWECMVNMTRSGKIELRLIGKQQHALFIAHGN